MFDFQVSVNIDGYNSSDIYGINMKVYTKYTDVQHSSHNGLLTHRTFM